MITFNKIMEFVLDCTYAYSSPFGTKFQKLYLEVEAYSSLVPRPPMFFKVTREKSGRPGRFCDVIIT